MPQPTTTMVYAGLIALMFVGLSIRVIMRRRNGGAALGDGDDADLRRRIRVHGNFAEYAPLTILLMLLAEIGNAPDWRVHLVGAALLIGRISHAYGVSREPENFRFRVAGMILTFSALISGAVSCLFLALA